MRALSFLVGLDHSIFQVLTNLCFLAVTNLSVQVADTTD